MDTTTNLSHDTETNTHTRHYIREILKKPMFVTVTVNTKGTIQSHTNNCLRHYFDTTPDVTVHPVRSPGSPPSPPDWCTDRNKGSHHMSPWRQPSMVTRLPPNGPTTIDVVTRSTLLKETEDPSTALHRLSSPSSLHWMTLGLSGTTTTVTDGKRKGKLNIFIEQSKLSCRRPQDKW